jgi:hypothetical protein
VKVELQNTCGENRPTQAVPGRGCRRPVPTPVPTTQPITKEDPGPAIDHPSAEGMDPTPTAPPTVNVNVSETPMDDDPTNPQEMDMQTGDTQKTEAQLTGVKPMDTWA